MCGIVFWGKAGFDLSQNCGTDSLVGPTNTCSRREGAKNEQRAVKWEDACFFFFVLFQEPSCRTARVGKMACAPFAAILLHFLLKNTLRTLCFLVCSNNICLCVDSETLPCCPLWVFVLPSARYTKFWEKGTGRLKSQQLCKCSWQEDLFYICKCMTLLLQSVRRKKDGKQKAFSWWMEM